MSAEIKASDVAELRKQTGAGMMDCKEALSEAGGDMEKAAELIRVKMGNKIGKLRSGGCREGTVRVLHPRRRQGRRDGRGRLQHRLRG